MTNQLISVIVPVYNVEKYLTRCVDSIRNQTYQNLEIILVDDGSTDDSGRICDELEKNDSRIKVIHQKNGGLSAARNTGIDEASGEYIAFVDSDDYIEETMYSDMIHALLEYDAVIVSSGIKYVDELDKIVYELSVSDNLIISDDKEKYRQLDENDILTVVQWNKLFKREALDGIRYPIGKIHEDVFVIHRELYNAERIVYLAKMHYCYVQRDGSIMNKDEKLSQIFDAIEGYEDRITFFKEKSEIEAYQAAIHKLYDYVAWKYDNFYRNGDKVKSVELSNKLRDIYEKYKGEATPSRGVLSIINHKMLHNLRLRYQAIKG